MKQTIDDFKRAMDFVLKWEGGYVNDKDDPGGETKYGISKRYHPEIDIKTLTEEQARNIYHEAYWIEAKCEGLPWPDCLIQFDTAVNLGVARAANFHILADNWTHYLFLRIEYYSTRVREKPFKLKYLRGWINRVLDLYKAAMAPPEPDDGAPDHPVSGYGKGPSR